MAEKKRFFILRAGEDAGFAKRVAATLRVAGFTTILEDRIASRSCDRVPSARSGTGSVAAERLKTKNANVGGFFMWNQALTSQKRQAWRFCACDGPA